MQMILKYYKKNVTYTAFCFAGHTKSISLEENHSRIKAQHINLVTD